MKKRVFLFWIIIAMMCLGVACGSSNDRKYTCKHCGIKMEAYWSYHDGYVCYSCNKKYYD